MENWYNFEAIWSGKGIGYFIKAFALIGGAIWLVVGSVVSMRRKAREKERLQLKIMEELDKLNRGG